MSSLLANKQQFLIGIRAKKPSLKWVEIPEQDKTRDMIFTELVYRRKYSYILIYFDISIHLNCKSSTPLL